MSFKDYSGKEWEKVPIAAVTTYRPGYICMTPSWWATVDGCVLMFRGITYQHNTSRAVIEHIHPTAIPVFLEQAYLPRRD